MFNTKKALLIALPFLATGALVGCGKKYDVKLVVYNWEDYIDEGTDEMGNFDHVGTIEAFEKYYKENTGLTLKVDYRTFATNEIMYAQIEKGSVSPDLVCPSDYMIQKMANEGMLEPFSYDSEKDTYGASLSNWDKYGSPFIRTRFAEQKLSDNKTSFLQYAVPYFWGTMGFTYDPEAIKTSPIDTWECLWSDDANLKNAFSLKDSYRDSYVPAIFHVYKDEIAAIPEDDPDYNAKLSAIFNRCDDATIAKVEAALKEAKKKTVKNFEVDDGKSDIVNGNLKANLAWSGDSVFSMDQAEEAGKTLKYSLPTEGSNVWFDGWCMPKGANKELAEEFVNFICAPENAAGCMEAVGYTSPIVGEEMWEYVEETYAAEEAMSNVYTVDLSFYFGDTVEDAKIRISSDDAGRQFDAQYPTEAALKKCCLMKDFGSQTEKVEAMWKRVKAA